MDKDTKLTKDEFFAKFDEESDKIHEEIKNLPDFRKFEKISTGCACATFAFVIVGLVTFVCSHAMIPTLILCLLGLTSAVSAGFAETKSTKILKKLDELDARNNSNFQKLCQQLDKIDAEENAKKSFLVNEGTTTLANVLPKQAIKVSTTSNKKQNEDELTK